MKLPKLGSGSIRRPKLTKGSGRRPTLQTPQFLDDLYRDLRDRRLLPVVGLLAVAIVAVPVALSVLSPTSAPPPDAAAALVPADAPEAQAAVLAENPGLRDYRERLDALKAKNPFDQQFETSALGETVVGDVSSGAPAGTASAAGGVPAAGAETITSSGEGAESISSGTATSTSESGSPSTEGGGGATGKPEIQYFTWRVDVRYGVDGDVKKHDDVKIMDILDPVGIFLGVSENGKRALFFISSGVVAATGEGDCAPSSDNCEMLALKEGQTQQLAYQPDATLEPVTYSLNLEQVKLIPVKKLPDAAALGK